MPSPRQSPGALIDAPPAVEVRPALHGLGVFAKRVIVPDEIIGEVTGTIVHEVGYGSEYCIDLDPGRALEPAAPFRYVNHCCDPNCEIFSWEEPEGDVTPDRVWLTALRAIQPGEELTIDYAWEAEAAIPCGCGSPNCRGWIVDEAELDEVLDRACRSSSA
jgi:SET domain-containing protein